MASIFFYDTDIGQLGIVAGAEHITHIYFESNPKPDDIEVQETELHRCCIAQLREYLAGERTGFDLPLAPQGAEFHQKVWDALLQIPYGGTASYKDIAAAVGSPKAFRAVGQANHNNPIPIIIPCHRVIGANGKLTGFGGGLDVKERLLALEAAQLRLAR